ncbi:hypothetical protein [Rhizobium leguminosarum]|uniref:hypothetical protein n=1 Tax=Rhizobium leguminosarum TaxID=384 RepID=UPI0010300EBD|nr:hypothetical protein [Rhizobium leguminosarum]TBF65682.1 hypothetical protein ELG89_34570 [Rhizobium leguminosarum]
MLLANEMSKANTLDAGTAIKILLTAFLAFVMTLTPAIPAGDLVKVLDFRDEVRSPELARDALTESEKEALFSSLYPLGNEELSGEMQAVRGSFSKPGGSQILVTFNSDTDNVHSGRHGNAILLEGGNVIAWANNFDTELIEGIADFDHDGLQEAVTSYTDGGQGEFHTEAATLTFKGPDIAILNSPITINAAVDKRNCNHDDGIVYTAAFYFSQANLIQKNYWRRCDEDAYQDYSEGVLIPNDWDHNGMSDDDGG